MPADIAVSTHRPQGESSTRGKEGGRGGTSQAVGGIEPSWRTACVVEHGKGLMSDKLLESTHPISRRGAARDEPVDDLIDDRRPDDRVQLEELEERRAPEEREAG